MAHRLDERTAQWMAQTLTERFGPPIAASQGSRALTCESCAGMLEIDDDTCTQCGMMNPGMDQAMTHQRMAEDEGPHHHPGHASNCTCPDCSRPEQSMDEKAPPGREKQVKALKKQKDVENPFAVAWASYNKKKSG
jgi:hypothetical protein